MAFLDNGRRKLGFSVPGHIDGDGVDLRGKLFGYRMRRCTGLRPSRTSGMARPIITLKEYSRYDFSSSSSMLINSLTVCSNGDMGLWGAGRCPGPPDSSLLF